MSDDLNKAIISTMSDILAAHLDAQKEILTLDLEHKAMIFKKESLAAHLSHVHNVQREILNVANDTHIVLHSAAAEILSALFAVSSLSDEERHKFADVLSDVFVRLSRDIGQSLHNVASKAQDVSLD